MFDSLRGRRGATIALLLAFAILIGGTYTILAGESNPYDIKSGATYNATDPAGPEIVLQEDLVNTTIQKPFNKSHEVRFHDSAWVRSEGSTFARLSGIESDWTYLRDIDVSNAPMVVEMPNTQRVAINSSTANEIHFRDSTVGDGQPDVAMDPTGGATMTIHDLPQDETVVAWMPAEDERLGFAATGADGVATFDLTAATTSSSATTEDVYLRDANEPIIHPDTAAPTTEIADNPDQLQVDVSHQDFPNTTVDVEFVYEGASIGTDTLDSNGTAAVNFTEDAASGDNDWYAVATDDYGNTNQSQNFTFTTPRDLEIRNETAPSQLVDNAEVTIEFYFDDGSQSEIVERNTTDGTVDMSGLPATQQFVVVAETTNYTSRRIFVRSLFDSQSVYLLPESEDYVDMTFELEDFSGNFHERNTVLEIERNLGGEWRPVQGDYFGAGRSTTAQLAYNERHRLTILNTETGEERRVGTLTPTVSEVRTIRVIESDVEIDTSGAGIYVEPATRTLPAKQNASVTAGVQGEGVDQWTVQVRFVNGSVDEQLFSDSLSESGEVEPTFNLSERDGGRIVVDVMLQRSDGSTLTQQVSYRVSEYYEHGGSLISVVTGTPGDLGLGSGGATLLAVLLVVGATTAVGTALRVSTELIGAAAVTLTVAFALVGWVSWDLVAAAGIAFGAMWLLWRGI